MNCKNCNTSLIETNEFCPNCGGKIIKKQTDFKKFV